MGCKKNNCINCSVESCKYHDHELNLCMLDEINVGCTCDESDCDDKKMAICESFEFNKEKED